MENYEIIIKEGQNPAWVVRKEREAREKGKIPVVACSNETKSIFERLIKRFDPDEKTISIFQSGFNDLKLTYLLRYVFYNSLQELNDVRPVDYIDEVFSLANGLKGDVREFFLNEFEFEFERENSLDKNLWKTRDKVLNEFKARREKETVSKLETVPMTPVKKKHKDFTTARQVLAMYYLFEFLKVENIDRTIKARFIEFLTCKNYDSIYDKLEKPFKDNPTTARKDLQYVRQHFENLGLMDIARMISNDMEYKI